MLPVDVVAPQGIDRSPSILHSLYFPQIPKSPEAQDPPKLIVPESGRDYKEAGASCKEIFASRRLKAVLTPARRLSLEYPYNLFNERKLTLKTNQRARSKLETPRHVSKVERGGQK